MLPLNAVWLMPAVKRDHLDSPHRLTWDGAVVERLLDGLGAAHLVGFDALPDGEGAVVVVPGGYYADKIDWLNERLARLPWCVVLVYADEGGLFPDADLKHEAMRVWRQAPVPGVHGGDRFLPMGAPPATSDVLAGLGPQGKVYDWSFAGQVNHERRTEAVDVLSALDRTRALLKPTRRFGSGMNQRSYLRSLARSMVVACPSGPVTADTFRVWESLHAGAVPVVDGSCPVYGEGFWSMLFDGPPPFPTVAEWSEFAAAVDDIKAGWPAGANRVNARWQRWLRDLKWRVADDITDVSGSGRRSRGNVTVLIPTSPIPSHPDTAMIEQTVDSVRHHLPDAEIILMADGVRPEQEHRRADYEAYLHRVLCLSANGWGAAVPLLFDEHQHQAGMTRRALDLVRTPLVLFVEHDTPLCADEVIDWAACEAAVMGGELNTVRFHFEAVIPVEHSYLMVDEAPVEVGGLSCIRTRQWSQRPHLASTRYYRRMLADPVWFPPDARTMIEDVQHSPVMHQPWADHKVAIYAPVEGHLKRSWNLDGREDDEKYEMEFGTRAEG